MGGHKCVICRLRQDYAPCILTSTLDETIIFFFFSSTTPPAPFVPPDHGNDDNAEPIFIISKHSKNIVCNSALSPYFRPMDRITTIIDWRVVNFPTIRWKDVFVSFKPTAINNFPRVTFIFFNSGIQQPNTQIFMNIKMKQWARFTSCFGFD